jgi:Icc-related predicted phosphoesterase
MDMRMLAGTDFHGFKPSFEHFANEAKALKVNLMLICGDVTNFGTLEQARTLLSILAETNILTLFVPGNCDPPSLINVDLDGVKCIHGSSILYDGFAFMGVGGSPITPFNTFFEMREEEIARVLQECLHKFGGETKRHNIILLSHSPPKNTTLDRTSLGIHAGSTSVRRFIEEYKPLLVICGHIHEAKGRSHINNTLIINPGPAKQGNYALITIKEDKIDVDFRSVRI